MLFSQCKGAFNQLRTWQRAKELAEGILSCMGRSTITGWLVSSGCQFLDWSASYRLFSGNRLDVGTIFSVIRKETLLINDPDEPNIYAHMDDTLLRKTGKKVSGAKWMRDPLGPPFQTNLVWGQRFLQISLSQFNKMGTVPSKTIPIDMLHCPAPLKPGKRGTQEQWEQYKECQKKTKMSIIGAERIHNLRNNLNHDGYLNKDLVISVDGSYTNQTTLKNLPDRVTIIGRIRKDCKLNELPNQVAPTGRKRIYGANLPTPEQIRVSDEYEWTTVSGYAAGKVHSFNVKTIENIRWRKAGERNMRLVIIKPVGYRLRNKSDLLHREPIYLICTDPNLPLEKLLQAYLWRWGIEVNFREEKTLLGCGQAQVRKEIACQKVPSFHTSIYAMLLLAGIKTKDISLPRPKWYKNKTKQPTTGDLINNYRATNWSQNMKISFTDFVNIEKNLQSRKNYSNPSVSSVIYARN